MPDRDAHGDTPTTGRNPGYELSDITTKVAVVSAVALVIAGVVIHVLVWLLYAYFGQATAATYSRQYPLAAVGAAPLPPGPMLQVKPREELKQLAAEEEAVLNGYAWVDRSAGIVRIPIDRAIELVLERGLPVRPAEGADAIAPSGQTPGLPQDTPPAAGAGETPRPPETSAGARSVGQASRLPARTGAPKQGAASGPERQ